MSSDKFTVNVGICAQIRKFAGYLGLLVGSVVFLKRGCGGASPNEIEFKKLKETSECRVK